MWISYAFGALSVLCIAVALFCWHLFRDAIRREIAANEVLCSILLSPTLHAEFQNVAYDLIKSRIPSGGDFPSEAKIVLLQRDLMKMPGNSAFAFVTESGSGETLRRILTSPSIIGGNVDELWRYAKPID